MALPPLSPDQRKRILSFLEDEWVDDDDDEARTEANLRNLLAQIETPLELHWCARLFNWDTECDTLRTLMKHPLCDRGTALAVFWAGQPDYYYRRPLLQLTEDERQVRTLLEEIERRYTDANGFAHATICTDPGDMDGEDMHKRAGGAALARVIPAEFFRPSPGTKPTAFDPYADPT